MNPRGLITAIQATFKGHLHGKFEGRETQLPATFVIDADKKNSICLLWQKNKRCSFSFVLISNDSEVKVIFARTF